MMAPRHSSLSPTAAPALPGAGAPFHAAAPIDPGPGLDTLMAEVPHGATRR